MRFHPRKGGHLSDEQAEVVRAIVQGPRGASIPDVDNLDAVDLGPFEPLLLDPELAMRVQALGERVRFRAALPPSERELAILLVARHWRSAYEWHVHHPLALSAGLAGDVAEQVRAGRIEGLEGLNGGVGPVVRFVSELLTAGRVGDEAFEAVASRAGEAGALDLVAIVGYYSLLAFVLNVDGKTEDDLGDPFAPPSTSVDGDLLDGSGSAG